MPPRTSKAKLYELDLLENGLDFVRSGLEIFFSKKTPKPLAHKYAILHIFSGMLLLLKERLKRVRPSLVFDCEADAGIPGAKTTDYHETCRRLEKHGIVIDPTKRAILDRVRIIRNAIEHYHVELKLKESREVIGEMVSFIHEFCLNELGIFIEDKLSRKALDRFHDLEEVTGNVTEFMVKDAEYWAEADEKYFRNFEESYAAMPPGELLRHASVGGARLAECPRCNENSLLYLEVGACVNSECRATFQLDTCRYCYATTFKGTGVCDACRNG